MNPKNTWMLVALAAGLFAFIYFFERHIQPPVPVVARVLPGLKVDDVSSIEIQPRDKFAIRVERVPGGWQLTKPITYAVRGAEVEAFLKALAELSPQRRISAEELQNNKNVNADFGFDTPQTTILLQQGDDQSQLKLGNPTPPGDGIYAQVVGTEGIDIIGAAFFGNIPTNAGQWRDTSFAGLQGVPFTELDVVSGTGQLKFQREAPGKLWAMVLPIRARADNEKIELLLDQLQNLSVSQFETDDSNVDLETYGLQTPSLALYFKDKNTNQLLSVQFGKSPANDTNLVYARTNSSSTIVRVPREDLNPWSADYSQFRDPHLLSLTISDKPGALECYGPDGRTNFIVQQASNGVVMVTDGQGLSFPADPTVVFISVTNLSEMKVVRWDADRFANDAVADSALPAMGLAPNPLRRYVLRAVPAGGTARVIAQVDFGSANTNQPGTICARRSDLPEELSVFAVNEADFNRLPASAYQLRLRRIWNFDATNITRLVIQANGQTREWKHQKENFWMPQSGVTDSGKGMVMENLVNILGYLTAEYWIGPGEPTAAYGFNANSMQISVTATAAGQPPIVLTVTFGGPVPGGRGWYACVQLDGQNWIFVYSARDVNELLTYLPADN
jgi:Domain of unknown function (DUF4340)